AIFCIADLANTAKLRAYQG
ncbi:hypothetical protein CCACVL1_03871, partial [Corchorus capsularis]